MEKEHLNPERTKKLKVAWQAPPGNSAAHYYMTFPHLEPFWLPDDHHIVKYNEDLYPKHRDYRTFKSAPKKMMRSRLIIIGAWRLGKSMELLCRVLFL